MADTYPWKIVFIDDEADIREVMTVALEDAGFQVTTAENGIAGLFAYTSPQNHAMINLFKSMPYRVQTSLDGESLLMSFRFEEKNE